MFSKDNPSHGNTSGSSSTRMETARRTAEIYSWMLTGFRGVRLIDKICVAFNISVNQAKKYVAKANALFAEETKIHASKTALPEALARFSLVYEKVFEAQKYKEAIKCLENMAKLQGLMDNKTEVKTDSKLEIVFTNLPANSLPSSTVNCLPASSNNCLPAVIEGEEAVNCLTTAEEAVNCLPASATTNNNG